jgi:hypothetical protein
VKADATQPPIAEPPVSQAPAAPQWPTTEQSQVDGSYLGYMPQHQEHQQAQQHAQQPHLPG